ncbi:MAG: GNAT family N-acetyltransferase [Anaerolineae bacterium]|nr:GNAT family N-acetyltransferase [Anaerolineae bacterium]
MHAIETVRLRLRPFRRDDAEVYYHTLMTDPDVQRYLPGGQPRPREQAEPQMVHFQDHWTQHGFGGWAVIHKADGALIGQCGLQYVAGRPEIELFYALAKPYWGRGLAPEAARAALRYGFEIMGFDRIVAVFAPENAASERVMIKLGMAHQGTLEAYNTVLPCYAITRQEFRPGDAPFTVEEYSLMPFQNLNEIESREVVPGIHGKFAHTDHMTVGHFRIEKGAILPEHAHPHEQITNMIEGQLEMTVGGETLVLTPGQVAVIPSNVTHSARALTECRVIDVFQPAREDYK